ncbi:MAG: DUF559 domain-containing protein [Candidatus Nanopelagicales bacterium]
MWTTAQKLLNGTTQSELKPMRKTARKVRRGTYTDDAENPWQIYRMQCIAVARAIAGSVLTGPSAAVIWGVATVDDPPSQVYIRGVTPGRYGADVKVLSGGTPDTTVHHEVAVASVVWTIIDCARVMSKRDALIAADFALHRRWCDVDALRVAAGAIGRVKRIERVRWVVNNADPESESAGETWLRMIVAGAGYSVRSQVRIETDDFRARVDLMIEGSNVILEFDGLMKYDQTDEEQAWRVVVEERRRHAMLEVLGYHVVRFVWEQLRQPEATVARIELAVSRGTRLVSGQEQSRCVKRER